MTTFSTNCQKTVNLALALANANHHEFATLEHLLFSLLDDPEAVLVLAACNVDFTKLRDDLSLYIDHDLQSLVTDKIDGATPTAGFQRVVQRAMIHVQSSGREQVTGANVLVAIFSERESMAAKLLQDQDMTRYDAVNFISHKMAKKPRAPVAATDYDLEQTLSPQLKRVLAQLLAPLEQRLQELEAAMKRIFD